MSVQLYLKKKKIKKPRFGYKAYNRTTLTLTIIQSYNNTLNEADFHTIFVKKFYCNFCETSN